MRTLLACLLALTLAGSALAVDLGSARPAKPTIDQPASVPIPDLIRQGGDTIAQAVPLVIGDTLDGTTTGYTDDYDEMCPYGGNAPDVVYTFTPAADQAITVDLYGSAYDTKVYIYDQDLTLIACNDDYYSDYTSRLENVPVVAGVQYFLIIDGYGTSNGVYTGYTEEFVPCVLECPAGAQLEGEPPISDGYEDNWKAGCGGYPEPLFQVITSPVFCGRSGYYQVSGADYRDTDWFHITIPAGGVLEITGDAEEAMYMFELGPQDCNEADVLQTALIGPCNPATMTIAGPAGSLVWFWCGPTQFWHGATYEFDYVLLLNTEVPVENHSWTGVKSLFD